MVSFGEKAKIKKAGNLNKGRSYVITTVPENLFVYNGGRFHGGFGIIFG